MAYSFCCAPLHAVRHFAQPPQGAEMFRVVRPRRTPLLRIDVAANPMVTFSSLIALGGYRLWRCQVVEKGLPIGAERLGLATQNTAAERLGSRLFWITQFPGSGRGQALALLSTARSERSA